MAADTTVCSTCNEPLAYAPRVLCPKCGGVNRIFGVSIVEEVHAEAFMKLHSKHREGGNKVLREIYSGDDYFRKEGRWSVIYRLIDRAKNWYEERIWDRKTGQLLISKAEPLTDHRKPKSGL